MYVTLEEYRVNDSIEERKVVVFDGVAWNFTNEGTLFEILGAPDS